MSVKLCSICEQRPAATYHDLCEPSQRKLERDMRWLVFGAFMAFFGLAVLFYLVFNWLKG